MALLKDVAKECGVSTATVSKALNDHRDISAGTKKRVRSVADRLGYYPNSAARTLKTKRAYNLGVLYLNVGIAHDYFSNVLESFRSAAEKKGYSVTLINQNIGERKASFTEICMRRGVDGVAILNADYTDKEIRNLVASDLHVVIIDYSFENRMSILSDNVEGVKALVEYVYARGHRKIAFIHGERTSVSEKRLQGFFNACLKLGVFVPDEYVREGRFHNPIESERLMLEILDLEDRPTCVLFPDDFSYIGGMNACRRRGVSIPGDISVVGYDGIYLSRVLQPSLTTWRQNTDKLGSMSAEGLIRIIEHPRSTLREDIVVEGYLLEGDSVKRVEG
jgi:DNA-binding LacI/PurR family transcriptional regulator